jgi:hypothetical protein
MALDATRVSKLRKTRCDYFEEGRWHKFLLDATHGTGGFRGRIGPPDVNVLGAASAVYGRFIASTSSSGSADTMSAVVADSYLDKFTREKDDKFAERVKVARYTNYAGPICQLILSYVNKAPCIRDGESTTQQEWRADADGNGNNWDALKNDTIHRRAGELGWCPVLLDLPDVLDGTEEEVSKARLKESQIRPIAIPLFPANILDWRLDESNEFTSVKIRTDHEVGDDLLEDAAREERYAIWYKDRVIKQTITIGADGQETLSEERIIKHSFGCVPLIVFRAEPTPGDAVRGQSIVSDLSVEARTHFNICSEKRDHERGQVFAILGIPVVDMDTDVGIILGGNGAGIKVPYNANMPLHYVAPPASVAESLEVSRGTSVKEMYRISRIEYEEPSTAATSGIARAYRFEQTNSRLRDLSGGFARSEQKLLRLVAKSMSDEEGQRVTVNGANDFGVEDLAADVESVGLILEMNVGPTAEKVLKARLVRKAAPNMPRDVDAAVEQEIGDQALQDEQDAAMEREVQKAGLKAAKRGVTGDPKSGDPGANQEEEAA